MAYTNITKDNFEQVIQCGKTIILDFWAPWCGPCRMIAPIVEEIAEEREDVILGKVNVDEEMELAIRFGIVSIPTLIILKDGKESAKAVGYRPKDDILKLLDN